MLQLFQIEYHKMMIFISYDDGAWPYIDHIYSTLFSTIAIFSADFSHNHLQRGLSNTPFPLGLVDCLCAILPHHYSHKTDNENNSVQSLLKAQLSVNCAAIKSYQCLQLYKLVF